MSNPSTQVMLTFGVDVTMDEHGRIELFQPNGDDEFMSGKVILMEDEARLLIMRLGRHLGMKVTYTEGTDDEG